MKVFIDTGVWFGYLVRGDQHHPEAAKVILNLEEQGALLVTSELVLSETYTLLMRKLGVRAALKFLNIIETQVEAKFTEITWVNWAIIKDAGLILDKFSDHQITFTDATSAAILKNTGIPAMATFDRHFRLLGIPCIP
ncbi:MAG: PIN domain-containing protein [Armatimonadetes bacterium]|nr:PIN domain-containing protein [Armatimonadota bacterium]